MQQLHLLFPDNLQLCMLKWSEAEWANQTNHIVGVYPLQDVYPGIPLTEYVANISS